MRQRPSLWRCLSVRCCLSSRTPEAGRYLTMRRGLEARTVAFPPLECLEAVVIQRPIVCENVSVHKSVAAGDERRAVMQQLSPVPIKSPVMPAPTETREKPDSDSRRKEHTRRGDI